MAAGDSAYDVARRQREKAARLQRSAALWEQGAAGEVAVAQALAGLPGDWVVLHDLAWPGRLRANIDHVAIGPGGVFVVDAKNWTGAIEVREQVLRQNGRAREEAVVSAAEAALALQPLAPTGHLVTGVLCFVRDEPLTGWARDVMVCTTHNLVAMLTSRPTVLRPDEVQQCVRAVRGGTSTRPARAGRAPRASRPQPSPLATGSRVSSRPRRRTPWFKIVCATAFLVLMLGGGLARMGEWAASRLADDVAPSAPADPASDRQSGVDTEKETRKQGDGTRRQRRQD